MENITYELFKFENSIPFKMFIFKLGNQKPHWHKELELIYVLEGSAKITTSSASYTLSSEDIMLINRYDTHYISGIAEVRAVCCHIQLDCPVPVLGKYGSTVYLYAGHHFSGYL